MMNPSLRASIAILLLTPVAFAQSPSVSVPLAAPKRPVIDEYHGVKVTDDYRWLENWDDPEVKQWSAAQNANSREYLDHLPARAAIKERFTQLISSSSPSYHFLQFRAGILFALKDQPPQQQPLLVALRSADDPASARIIFDRNAASSNAGHGIGTSLDEEIEQNSDYVSFLFDQLGIKYAPPAAAKPTGNPKH